MAENERLGHAVTPKQSLCQPTRAHRVDVANGMVLHDEIWVRDTVNTNFMEGVLLVVSTGFAPGSIYGLTLFYFHDYFAVCAILDPVRSFWYDAFFESLVKI